MRHVIATGTDVAMVCFFDPAALPSAFDKQMQQEALETMEKTAADGRMGWVQTGGDGRYLFHFYINDEVPATIQRYCLDPETAETFRVPSGTIWACGTEYAALDPKAGGLIGPKGGLGKYPHMGASFNIQPGEYALKMWRTEWPDGAMENVLMRALGKSRLKWERWLGTITGMLFLSVCVTTIVVLILTIHHPSVTMIWSWLGVAVMWTVCIAFSKRFQRMQSSERQTVELEFPSIVVQMTMKS